jgi:ketosteroid isomerase-like protein
MRRILGSCIVLAWSLIACSSAAGTAAPATDLQHNADMYLIDQIEANWHQAASTKDVDLMMSLWADNATFTVGTKTYTGKAEIRAFITQAAPFKPENHWVSETPAYKIKTTVNGDTGTLYFECHYVDVATQKIAIVVGANQDVARIGGKWLITKSIAATPELAP